MSEAKICLPGDDVCRRICAILALMAAVVGQVVVMM